jgi:hypothetical protein
MVCNKSLAHGLHVVNEHPILYLSHTKIWHEKILANHIRPVKRLSIRTVLMNILSHIIKDLSDHQRCFRGVPHSEFII